MNKETSEHVEDAMQQLALQREQVEHWVKKARQAVLSFKTTDGKKNRFYQDSESTEKDTEHQTTSMRCWNALACVDRAIGMDRKAAVSWDELADAIREMLPTTPNPAQHLFGLAHDADGHLALHYHQHFACSSPPSPDQVKSRQEKAKALHAEIAKKAKQSVETALKAEDPRASPAPLSFTGNETGDRHYFVTLHTLRALRILSEDTWHEPLEQRLKGKSRKGYPKRTDHLKAIYGDKTREALSDVRAFCVHQCLCAREGITHQMDPIQLSFAAVIYAMYDGEAEAVLCDAIVVALRVTQQENGTWPATRPIIRKKPAPPGPTAPSSQPTTDHPWHITSHEVALCLTWLYFQPVITEETRRTLLAMMSRYFTRWVIPTYRELQAKEATPTKEATPERMGWYHDHHVRNEFVEGWATAIVCHFLANYSAVLDHHINQRVIETLGLERYSTGYLIDVTQPRKAGWAENEDKTALWCDLPPLAFVIPPTMREKPEPGQEKDTIAAILRRAWTDPSCVADGTKSSISAGLGERLLRPFLENIQRRPKHSAASIVLYGAPGTRKSTLVNAIAKKVLGSTYVEVPASVIFAQGWDHMHAQAQVVFRHLTMLTSCVVFFDEFEEFLLKRDRDRGDDQRLTPAETRWRTLAAFITSAMLPLFQTLNDARRSLVLLATNNFDDIDPAARRQGRFDYQAEIGNLAWERATQYLENLKTIASAHDLTRGEPTLGEKDVDESPAFFEHLKPKHRTAIVKALEATKAALGSTKEDNVLGKARYEALRENALREASGKAKQAFDLEQLVEDNVPIAFKALEEAAQSAAKQLATAAPSTPLPDDALKQLRKGIAMFSLDARSILE